MSNDTVFYRADFLAWTRQQAEALRSAARGGSNQKLDWENLAEEIESLGRSDRRELGSQIRRIIEHLLKLEYSRAINPRYGWIESIGHARNEIEVLLDDSPSLKQEIPGLITAESRRASRQVARDLQGFGEVDRTGANQIGSRLYTADQIFGDWFPPEPPRE